MPILNYKTRPATIPFFWLPVWTVFPFPEVIFVLSLTYGSSALPPVALVLILAPFPTFWLAGLGPVLSGDCLVA